MINPFRFNNRTTGARFAAVATGYCAIIGASLFLSYELRFDFDLPPEYKAERFSLLMVAVAVKFFWLLVFRQFGSLLTFFSVPDLLRIVAAMGSSGVAFYVVRGFAARTATWPRGVILIDFVLSVVGLCVMRLGFRMYRERFGGARLTELDKVRRIAVIGAGDAGAKLVGEALGKPRLGLRPVFFLDDERPNMATVFMECPSSADPTTSVIFAKSTPSTPV